MSAPHQTAETVGPLPAGWELSVFADEISPDLDAQLAEVSRAGLRFFDLRSAFGKNVLELTDREVQRVADAGAGHGLKVLCIGSPINKHPFNPLDKSRECERLKRIIEIAQSLHARYIRVFTPLIGGAERAPSYEEINEWMLEQAELATRHRVVLLVENDADAYAAFPENALRLFTDVSSPHFQAVFDFSNAVLIGYPAKPHWFPWIEPFLGGLHIKDSLYAKDEEGGDQIVPAGEGEGFMREIIEYLIAAGWKGPVSIEPHLWKIGKRLGLDGVGTFRLALKGLNQTVEGLV
jgi:sugar phosphate isomerase/epimerase